MKCYVLGIGMGNPKLLTIQAKEIIETSTCLIGAQRMLNCFPESKAIKVAAATPEKMKQALSCCRDTDTATVLVSGDCGFYSAANGLSKLLSGEKIAYIPGISSLQYFCAQLNLSWDDVKVISLHGRKENLINAVLKNTKTFVLTGGNNSAAAICKQMCTYGLGSCFVHVGERLSYSDERITSEHADALKNQSFDSLAVMLIENPNANDFSVTHGLSDEQFLRGNAPMTKSEVRTVSISKLQLNQGQTVWDVGAGTGSVSIEIARILPEGMVYAVEKETDAIMLLKQNQDHFKVQNLQLVEGIAPDALKALPVPDSVFIGGSSGQIDPIIDCILQKNPRARIVANAITLETVNAVISCFKRCQLQNQEVLQLFVAKSKPVGKSHMMLGQNPVYILSAGGE